MMRIYMYNLDTPGKTRRTFKKAFPKNFTNSIEGDRLRLTYNKATVEEWWIYTDGDWRKI